MDNKTTTSDNPIGLIYSFQAAYLAGFNDHPATVMQSLGFEVIKSELGQIFQFGFFEVKPFDFPLPEFIHRLPVTYVREPAIPRKIKATAGFDPEKLRFEENYKNSIRFLCSDIEYKKQAFDSFVAELQESEVSEFKSLIVKIAIAKQKINNLNCKQNNNLLCFDFNLSFLICNREFYQRIDLETLEFHPSADCE